MNSVGEFLAMGGYGFYVWTSYAIWLAIIVFNIVKPKSEERRLLAKLARKHSQSAG